MTSVTRRTAMAATVFALMTFGTDAARADPVTYLQTVRASGTLGSTPFDDALVTFTQVADTEDVVIGALFRSVQSATSTVAVDGIGTATIQVPTITLSAPAPGGFGGLYRGDVGIGGPVILTVFNTAFTTYDLRSSIGPLSGGALVAAGVPLATTAGDLVIVSVSGIATFQATVATAVPEPTTFATAGLGLLMGLGYAWRRRRVA